MVDVLVSAQALEEVVTIATVVGGALDLGKMGHLMHVGLGLVLAVAGSGGSGQLLEVQIAVGHVACSGDGVGENTALASAVHVGAVVPGVAGVGGSALGGDSAEDVGNGLSGLVAVRLEVLLHLVAGTTGGSLLSLGGHAGATRQSLLSNGELVAGAVALNLGALVVESGADGKGLGTIDFGLDAVRVEGYGTDELGAVILGEGEGALGEDIELAARGKIMELGDVKVDFDGLARGDALEGGLFQAAGIESDADAVEGDVLLYWLLVAGQSKMLMVDVRESPGPKTSHPKYEPDQLDVEIVSFETGTMVTWISGIRQAHGNMHSWRSCLGTVSPPTFDKANILPPEYT